MIKELPNDWFEEEGMQSYVLSTERVLAEVNGLIAALLAIKDGAYIAKNGVWMDKDLTLSGFIDRVLPGVS